VNNPGEKPGKNPKLPTGPWKRQDDGEILSFLHDPFNMEKGL
jgi:hypothetical protein